MAKLRGAKLSSCQLPTYFAGYRAWKDLRKAAQAKPGFQAGEFHKKALQAGALPLGTLRQVMGL